MADIELVIGAANRVVITLVAAMCLWMGWYLFRQVGNVAQKESAQVTWKDVAVKLHARPGIFFIALGTVILVANIWHGWSKATVTKPDGTTEVRTSFLGEVTDESLERMTVALNQAIQISRTPRGEPAAAERIATLAKYTPDFISIRDAFLSQRFGESDFKIWQAWKARGVAPPEKDKDAFMRVDALANDFGVE